jgi:heme/copper-type cytochrome/quinol oxidase subunit 3
MANNTPRVRRSLLLTIRLGVLFLYGQFIEYTGTSFTMRDSAYGSTFFMVTGFHGFHVLVGRLYLLVCYFMITSSSRKSHTALSLARVYWHFVDIVWVFVLL